MDDLMRNPSQAPAPPKKPILRKGSGAVLRSPPRPRAGSQHSPRPATVPAQRTAPAASAHSPASPTVRAATANAERPRREWSEGLKHFIAGQRGAARLPLQQVSPVNDAAAWASWQQGLCKSFSLQQSRQCDMQAPCDRRDLTVVQQQGVCICLLPFRACSQPQMTPCRGRS